MDIDMKRKDLLFWMIMGGCFFPTLASAQDSAEEEARKKAEINKIKLSENTIYADVIEMVTDDNEAVSLAQQKSMNMLQMHVIEMFAKRMNMPPEDVQEIWDVIDDKCQNIVVKKGDLFRVFTYIVKDAVGLGRRKPKKGDVEKYLTPTEEKDLADAQKTLADMEKEVNREDSLQMTAQAEVKEQPVAADTAAAAPAAQVPAAVVPAAAVPPVEQGTVAQVLPKEKPEEGQNTEIIPPAEIPAAAVNEAPKTVTVPIVADNPVAEVKEEPKPAVKKEPEPAVKKEPEPAVKEEPVAAHVMNVVQNVPEMARILMAQGDMKSLLAYLKAEKDKHTLMYGNIKNMIYKDKCYIVIVNKSTKMIETVLGKGFDERMNYKTMKMDKLDRYTNSNFSAVLVQEY